MDGALGANNPIYDLWNQAQDVWGPDELLQKLQCIVSIGTGVPSLKPVSDDALGIMKTLKELATETDKTAQQFHRDKAILYNEKRYYRFNVDQGLQDVGLEESKKKKVIVAATRNYVTSQTVFGQMQDCAQSLIGRQSLDERQSLVERQIFVERPRLMESQDLYGIPSRTGSESHIGPGRQC